MIRLRNVLGISVTLFDDGGLVAGFLIEAEIEEVRWP